jgi:alpha-tubulin suppressor-like RCC1 family protein
VVACGENFSALLTSSGQLFLSGTIGDKNLFYSDKPTLVDVPRSIRPAKLFAASNSVAVVSENGQLFTLGLNSHGQLGVATESKFQRALQRVPLKGKTALDANAGQILTNFFLLQTP